VKLWTDHGLFLPYAYELDRKSGLLLKPELEPGPEKQLIIESRRPEPKMQILGKCDAFHRIHGRMARGDYGLPKDSPGPAKPYPSTSCGQLPLKRVAGVHSGGDGSGVDTSRAGSLRPSSTPVDTPRRTPLIAASDATP
jgi:hypothetical protein